MHANALPFDVVILGGGPAGLATALALRQARPAPSVAVVTPAPDNEPRVGESVPPSIEPLLRQLGVLDKFLRQGHLPAFSTAAAWGSPAPISNEFFFNPHHRGWQLDRSDFELMLAEAARDAGSFMLAGRFVDAELDKRGHWQIDVRTAQGASRLTAGFVVDATGRRALFATRAGARAVTCDALLGVVRFFAASSTSELRGVLVEACRDGWWYSAPLPRGGMVAAAMTDAPTARQRELATVEGWNAALVDAPYTMCRLNEGLRTAESRMRVTTARSQYLPACTGHRWLAVGDSASTVDPLSSLGIVRALRFGLYAAYAIRDLLAGKPSGLAQYEALARRDRDSHLSVRAEVYGQEQRWIEAPFWASRRRSSAPVARPLQNQSFRIERTEPVLSS